MRVKALINWYEKNHRDLPWRRTTDPYRIWLSEVILQQTRVDQGLPYYEAFVKAFPTVNALAAAPLSQVYKLWQGLGYYSRAANMHQTANQVVNEHKGRFSGNYAELIKLKGIGPYTAAAIASIAFGEVKAVVDGNVYRVLSRVYEIETPIDSTSGKKTFSELAGTLIDPKKPALFNQALMELGATVCKPRNPLCEICPLEPSCLSRSKGTQASFPVKAGKQKQRTQVYQYLFFVDKAHTWIQQRKAGIWLHLFEPPLIEGQLFENPDDLIAYLLKHRIISAKSKAPGVELGYSTTHQLTHLKIEARFWVITGAQVSKAFADNYLRVALKDLHTFPVHRLFDKFLNSRTLHQESGQQHVRK